jgi:hypothetical protein
LNRILRIGCRNLRGIFKLKRLKCPQLQILCRMLLALAQHWGCPHKLMLLRGTLLTQPSLLLSAKPSSFKPDVMRLVPLRLLWKQGMRHFLSSKLRPGRGRNRRWIVLRRLTKQRSLRIATSLRARLRKKLSLSSKTSFQHLRGLEQRREMLFLKLARSFVFMRAPSLMLKTR